MKRPASRCEYRRVGAGRPRRRQYFALYADSARSSADIRTRKTGSESQNHLSVSTDDGTRLVSEYRAPSVRLDAARLRWRRGESNPRPRPHRQSVYKLRLPFRFARRPVDSRPTAGLVILWCRASGDDVPSAPSPFVDAADRATGRARSDAPRYGLGSESECVIVIRTCVVFPVVLRGRPGTSACNSAGEPTTSKPGRPRMSSHIVAAALRGKNLVHDARPSHDHRRRLSRRR